MNSIVRVALSILKTRLWSEENSKLLCRILRKITKYGMFRMSETHFNMSTSCISTEHCENIVNVLTIFILPSCCRWLCERTHYTFFFSCLMLNRIYGFAFCRKDSIDSFLFATTVFCWIHYKVYIYINIMLHHGFLLIAKTGGAVGS